MAKKSLRSLRRARARATGPARITLNEPPVPQIETQKEYLVRFLQSKAVEVIVRADNADTAQELAVNGLGRRTEEAMIYSEIKSVSEIG